jgi:hypothetical protein
MSGKINLVPPEGVTSASFEGVEYPVDENGICEVPTAAALTLYGFGFDNAPAVPEEPAKPETAAQKKAREKAEAEAATAAEAEAKEGTGDGNAPTAPAADTAGQ